jgi:zinc D-Ala-D-Ala carboxypeptidase
MTQLSAHFTLSDFTDSDTASRNHINNTVPDHLYSNMQLTIGMLERIRAYLTSTAGRDVPVFLSSGYRCIALNNIVSKNPNSDHTKAFAADIKCPNFGSPFLVASTLAPKMDALGIGQIIYEFNSWVHVSVKKPLKDVNRIITINKSGTSVGIVN